MTELFHDTHFWVLLASVIFAGIAWKKGKAPLLAMLDARTARIQSELEEARRLKAEAQALLDDVKKKHADAVQTSQKIIDNAKDNAKRLQEEAATKLQDSIQRRETQLLERISRAEAAAVQELRAQAADIAARSAELLLQDAMSKRGGKLVDEAIADIPERLN